ncbi:MAG: hypothetical protein KDD33_05065 [Bdellovibrionales bacterium]|nr:hypothetical protein [Bdellovibrionales bacterium]
MKPIIFIVAVIALALAVGMSLFNGTSTLERKSSGKSWPSDSMPKVAVSTLNLPLETTKVTSVAKYVVLSQLGRSLVKLNKEGQYAGDLAEWWEISPNLKEFKFKLKKDGYFSDGQLITTKHVECSLKRQIKFNQAIHYDFSSVAFISADQDFVTITLKEPNPRFIQSMSHPEFFVLPPGACNTEPGQVDWSITSGPYYQKKMEGPNLILSRNPYYPNFLGPEQIEVIGEGTEKTAELLKSGQLDFCLGSVGFKDSEIKQISASHHYQIEKPHIGFTFWIAINELSPDLKDIGLRKFIMQKLRENFEVESKYEPFWENADQIYLPDGSGRMGLEEVKEFWANLKTDTKDYPFNNELTLKLLILKSFEFKNKVVEALKKSGFRVEVTEYSNLKEYEELISKNPKEFHLVQINNDFSALDLFGNLQVTFSPSRPLIFFESKRPKIDKLMKIAEFTENQDDMYQSYKDIEELLLEEALVFPLAHKNMIFLIRDSISIEEWSKLFPEVSFWKMRPKM